MRHVLRRSVLYISSHPDVTTAAAGAPWALLEFPRSRLHDDHYEAEVPRYHDYGFNHAWQLLQSVT